VHDDVHTFTSEDHDVTRCVERGDGPEIDAEVWYVNCVEKWYIVCRLGDDTLTPHSHDQAVGSGDGCIEWICIVQMGQVTSHVFSGAAADDDIGFVHDNLGDVRIVGVKHVLSALSFRLAAARVLAI
jgi:hypothetical protein